MEQLTAWRTQDETLSNVQRNLDYRHYGQSLKMLAQQSLGDDDRALVIAAGPSVKRQNPAQMILGADFKGAVIATESAMLYCLRNGIIPDLVVTVDPHASRIVRWFGDPDLTDHHLRQDDYFSRQDMDEQFANQMRANEDVYKLVNQYGPRMKIALSTSASEKVVKRVIEAGMDIYWWNPMLDDPDQEQSISRKMMQLNGFPSMNAGGNVGTACWMMADAVLRKQDIGIVGMDFGYYAEVPYQQTQYYYELVDLVGEANLDSVFMKVFNPHLQQWFYTDPAYMWYRQSFLELVENTESQTFNCTEGGILFGDKVKFIKLVEFLHKTY
ncbi:MAG: DUF115 domain-containing protein [Methylococcaceae bacterium]|nr:DUF115 domain-containing protein [Methylococcaceae bacterium]